MLVILSQKVDTASSYSDELFNSYHYPAKYRNQLHEGDIFIYYQGNRHDKSHRYYFGIGTVGEILTTDGENYYAKLLNCQQFEKKVPIYLPDGGYIEQLGYETVRNSINPPWQSSIRPLSQKAFDYILNAAGIQNVPPKAESIDMLKEKLRNAVRDYFVEKNAAAIHHIESIAAAIGRATNISEKESQLPYAPSETASDKRYMLLEYCRTMKMSYSYKPVLILALLHTGKNGTVAIEKAAQYFYDFYEERRRQGLPAEKKRCIYLRDDVTQKQIMANLVSNPVKALCESGFFFFNEQSQVLSMSPEIWSVLDRGSKAMLTRICRQRLKEYYAD
jgi:hypothetical protein